MTAPNHRAIKQAVLQRNPTMGMPQEWYGEDGMIDPSQRVHILRDVHAAHQTYLNTLRQENREVPQFLTRDTVNGLLGVEGFLMPKRLASYNTPPSASYTGVLQFGSAAFHTHANQIAQRLNVMMRDPEMANTSLGRMIQDGRVQFPFTRDNVWNVHLNPVAQMVGTAIHTADKHQRIDQLVAGGRINANEARALFVIAHNIPRLSELMMRNLGQGTDTPTRAPEVARYAPLMATNPALYQDTDSLRGILNRVSEYAAAKANGIDNITNPGQSRVARVPVTPQERSESRSQLTNLIAGLLREEAQRRSIAESDRVKLNEMIRAVTQDGPVPEAPESVPVAARTPAAPVPARVPVREPAPALAVARQPAQPVARQTVERQPAAVAQVQPPRQPVKRVHDDAYRPQQTGTLDGQHRALEARRLDAREADDAERAIVRSPNARPTAPKGRPIVTNSIS